MVAYLRNAYWLRAVLAVACALIIAWGSLTPGDEMPRNLPWDKFNHFIGYAGLAFWVRLSGLRGGVSFLVAAGYGVAIEMAQMGVAGRSGGDWEDILANSLGAASALIVIALWRRRSG
ncbi:VanZ family protein [Halomonas sp. WWR20]